MSEHTTARQLKREVNNMILDGLIEVVGTDENGHRLLQVCVTDPTIDDLERRWEES